MNRYLRIINIDGTKLSGKTTQARMLAKSLKEQGYEVVRISDISSSVDLGMVIDILEKDEYTLVVAESGIARKVCVDLVNGEPIKLVRQNHGEALDIQAKIAHKYGMANILLVLDSGEVVKRSTSLEETSEAILDSAVVNMLADFDNFTISGMTSFHPIEISGEDKILDVQKMIVDYIEDNFEIKKPSE